MEPHSVKWLWFLPSVFCPFVSYSSLSLKPAEPLLTEPDRDRGLGISLQISRSWRPHWQLRAAVANKAFPVPVKLQPLVYFHLQGQQTQRKVPDANVNSVFSYGMSRIPRGPRQITKIDVFCNQNISRSKTFHSWEGCVRSCLCSQGTTHTCEQLHRLTQHYVDIRRVFLYSLDWRCVKSTRPL